MSHAAILDREQTYTFSRYFELNADPEEIFAELGVRLESQGLELPKTHQLPDTYRYWMPGFGGDYS